MSIESDTRKIRDTLTRSGYEVRDGEWLLGGGTQTVTQVRLVIQRQLPPQLRDASATYIEDILNSIASPATTDVDDTEGNPMDGSHLRDCLSDCLEHARIVVNEGGRFARTMADGVEESLSTPIVDAEIKQRVRRLRTAGATKYTPDDVAGELPLLVQMCYEHHLSGLRDRIRYVPDKSALVDRILTEWHRLFAIDQDLSIWLMLVKHWLWCVKRRVFGRTTKYEIFLALFGNQGTGKSWVLMQMIGVIFEGYYDPTITLDRLVDERNRLLLKTNFVMNMEEMSTGSDTGVAKMDSGAIATLKMLITNKTATYRPMHTNSSEEIPIRASFICSCNYHLYKIINDPTGMRRFYEFTSPQPPQVSVHVTHGVETMEALYASAMDLWTGISEDIEEGYYDPASDTATQIKADQASYIRYDSFTEWLHEHYSVGDATAPKSQWCLLKSINSEYQLYCKEAGISRPVQYGSLLDKIGVTFGVGMVEAVAGYPHRANVVRIPGAPYPETTTTYSGRNTYGGRSAAPPVSDFTRSQEARSRDSRTPPPLRGDFNPLANTTLNIHI